jgi:hypothetical protein
MNKMKTEKILQLWDKYWDRSLERTIRVRRGVEKTSEALIGVRHSCSGLLTPI